MPAVPGRIEKAIAGLRPSFSAHVRWGEHGAPVRFPPAFARTERVDVAVKDSANGEVDSCFVLENDHPITEDREFRGLPCAAAIRVNVFHCYLSSVAGIEEKTAIG